MPAPVAYFTLDGDRFVASTLTRGPWSAAHQHGGPPTALVARALETQWPEHRLVRLTVEFLRPVPIAALSVKLEVLRAGRKVVRAAALVMADGDVVVHAFGLLIRPGTLDVFGRPQGKAIPPPEAATPFSFPFFRDPVSYDSSVETRLAAGTFGSGVAFAWMRLRVPLIAGETPSPVQRACVVADSGSGIGALLIPEPRPLLNADLTVAVYRPPDGEWIGLDVVTLAEPSGLGLTRTQLHDHHGAVGEALQNLLAEPSA